MSRKLQTVVQRALDLPGMRHWRQHRFDRSFEAGGFIGCFRGVFPDAASAAASAPRSRPMGYDHADAAAMYRDRLDRVYPADYPMMLWLQSAFADGARHVFDLGGHIGIAYYAYASRIAYPQGLTWTVADVPAVMDSGRREALQRDPAGRLHFSDAPQAASEADVFFTAGCLQYLEPTLADRLAALERRPRWLLVNLLPLHPRWAYWTVQNIGTSFCPYRVQHDATFFEQIEALGYERLDRWENLEKSCWIAFHPEHSLDRYHGAAFRLR